MQELDPAFTEQPEQWYALAKRDSGVLYNEYLIKPAQLIEQAIIINKLFDERSKRTPLVGDIVVIAFVENPVTHEVSWKP